MEWLGGLVVLAVVFGVARGATLHERNKWQKATGANKAEDYEEPQVGV